MKILRILLGAVAAGLLWMGFQTESDFIVYAIAGIICSGLASYVSFQKGMKRRIDPVLFASPFLIFGAFAVFFAKNNPQESVTSWLLAFFVALALNSLSDELLFRTVIENQENT